MCVNDFLCCSSGCDLEDWNIVVDFCAMLLCHALGDPYDVATFLFFELKVGVEDSEMELLHESVNVQFDLKKLIFNSISLILI